MIDAEEGARIRARFAWGLEYIRTTYGSQRKDGWKITGAAPSNMGSASKPMWRWEKPDA